MRQILEGGGAALILLLPNFYTLLLPSHLAVYHHRLPIPHMAGGLLLDLLLTSLAVAALIASLKLLPGRARIAVGSAFAALILWRLISDIIFFVVVWHSSNQPEIPQRLPFYWGQVGHPLAAALVILALFFAWFRPKFMRAALQATRVCLAGIAFSGLWIVPQLVLLASTRPEIPPLHSRQTEALAKGRVVWILFDELSYDLVFEHPPAGLQFPNFQKLSAQSTSFSNLKPVGLFTDRIVLSLAAGVPIHQIRSTLAGKVSYLDPAQKEWRTYDPQRSVFGLAEAENWNPGIVGWYNPYCRVFPEVLTACSSLPGIHVMLPFELLGGSESKSVFSNALVIPRAMLAKFSAPESAARQNLLEQNIRDYRNVMGQAEQLIHDSQIRFVFLHLPVPHPPGIYNRTTHTLTAGGTYLDNLVLADDTLGRLIEEIGGTPSAKETTLIVSSDHSWRTMLWKQGTEWTSEEEQISAGQFDPRPVLMIHFPDQKTGGDVVTALPQLIQHDILSGILKKQVSNPEGLNTLVAQEVQHTNSSEYELQDSSVQSSEAAGR